MRELVTQAEHLALTGQNAKAADAVIVARVHRLRAAQDHPVRAGDRTEGVRVKLLYPRDAAPIVKTQYQIHLEGAFAGQAFDDADHGVVFAQGHAIDDRARPLAVV